MLWRSGGEVICTCVGLKVDGSNLVSTTALIVLLDKKLCFMVSPYPGV